MQSVLNHKTKPHQYGTIATRKKVGIAFYPHRESNFGLQLFKIHFSKFEVPSSCKIKISLFEVFSRSRKRRSKEIRTSPLNYVIYSYSCLWTPIISFNTYSIVEMMHRKYASTKTRHFSRRSDERECPKRILSLRSDLSAIDLL